jgi:hypothetical protein
MTGPSGRAVRSVDAGMRRLLLIASGLVLLAGIQLFIFAESTDRHFAWTIHPALTAAFLGAGYWASVPLELLAAREKSWANARVAVPAVFVFTALTLVATLIHLDRFHFHSSSFETRAATWGWIAIYAAVPPAMLLLFVRQVRLPGPDPPRRAPLETWARTVFALQAASFLALGIALFVAPDETKAIWPWTLTPLTARAIAAWLIGIGVAAAHVLVENDWRRARVASISYAVLGVLQPIALARYSDTLEWNEPESWLYVVAIVSVLGIGLYGILAARRARG